MSKIICITGMHRSGTSLTASWLQQCGLKIENGQLIGAAAGNYNGHFEDKEFVDLHSQIILGQNKNSKGWIEYVKKYHFQQREKEKIRILLEERKDFELWGWKDPRSVLFLDDWIKTIPNLKFIFLWRPAFEVVNSLIERTQNSNNPDFEIDYLKAYRTWKHYNRQIINFRKKYPDNTLLLNINYIVDKDYKVVKSLNKKFEFNLEFFPIEDLLDKNLLRQKKFKIIDKFYYKVFKLSKIENQLQILSFN